MRIHFLNRGHAERCLKNCRFNLETTLSVSGDYRLPIQRLRNAFCQGLGYGSYDELGRVLASHPTTVMASPAPALQVALIKSFKLGLDLALTSGCHITTNLDDLAVRLSKKAVRDLKRTAPRPTHERYLPPPRARFYRSTIEGRKFLAGLSVDGPYVSDGDDDVCIGASSIVKFAVRLLPSEQRIDAPIPSSRWIVVKYADEKRIDLSSLSDQGRLEFSRQFGVPISERLDGIDDHGALFFRSEAFLALCEWAKAHPRLAKRIKDHCSYVPTLPEELARVIEKRTEQ